MANHQADKYPMALWVVALSMEAHNPTEAGERARKKLITFDWTKFGILVDRQGIPVDSEIASHVYLLERSKMACENGIYWNCDSCACEDDNQRHV